MRFLFQFGFQEPKHWFKRIGQRGWDQEDSMAFFVEAPSEELALQWGREVAEEFASSLFKAEGWSDQEVPSWKAADYAHWIATDLPDYAENDLDQLPIVPCGEMPIFTDW